MKTHPIFSTILTLALFAAAGCSSLREDYTRNKSNICELHHQAMEKTAVPVHYGLHTPFSSNLDRTLVEATENTFPHAENSVSGGCNIDSVREAVIYTCPECVKARHQWETNYDAKHSLATIPKILKP